MFAIGHEELARNGPVGDSVHCTRCGLEHPVEFGESVASDGTRTPSRKIAFYRCGEKMYLAAIDGFMVVNKSRKETAMKKAITKKATKLVVVRTLSAGVHIGDMVSRRGKEVVLRNARRLWRWRGANTLHEVASRGVDDAYTRLSEPVEEIVLTEAIEIIRVKAPAIESLTRSRWGA